MGKKSAGIVAYKFVDKKMQVYLVHPGGPFWKNKDAGAWSIPKGEYEDGEEAMEVAIKEFEEETGNKIDVSNFITLPSVKQVGGKVITAWAVETDFEQAFISSNTFELEWPPKSGRMQTFPEVDNAGWFSVEAAAIKLNKAQFSLISSLIELVGER